MDELKKQEADHSLSYKSISDERIRLSQQLHDAQKAGNQDAIDSATFGLNKLQEKENAFALEKKQLDADKIKAAMQLSFDAKTPIEIRNFGFNALAFGKDTFVSSPTSDGDSTNQADHGYLQVSRYDSANAPKSAYDHGREKGFMGVRMNGNLALQGKVMMFGCDASHPRC